ncbi:MAG: hypothetical protein ACLFU9_07865 [Candidatus Bathyarchaeia archaeon]
MVGNMGNARRAGRGITGDALGKSGRVVGARRRCLSLLGLRQKRRHRREVQPRQVRRHPIGVFAGIVMAF